MFLRHTRTLRWMELSVCMLAHSILSIFQVCCSLVIFCLDYTLITEYYGMLKLLCTFPSDVPAFALYVQCTSVRHTFIYNCYI